ncbi:hypothetical protein [Azospirillum sp. SYSU D00513]|uniref:hypothetical protein n=1 Tax=Azospirillum sp. SYSU D00513 TaxID=2812561 RepID=UPI001A95D320|nr:hypothetical protein [Azospirillum sp. SYSU D00513]
MPAATAAPLDGAVSPHCATHAEHGNGLHGHGAHGQASHSGDAHSHGARDHGAPGGGSDGGHASHKGHAGCCLMACGAVALEPARAEMTPVSWTEAVLPAFTESARHGRALSPPRRPPRAA